MRLISQDSELLVILQVLLDKIADSLKNKKCLVIVPDNLNLPEEKEVKKAKDFSFKTQTQDIPATECFRLFGVLLYHLVTGYSEYNRESYLLDGYRKPLNSCLWPVIVFLLSGEVDKSEQVKGVLTPNIKKQAKANGKDLNGESENTTPNTSVVDLNTAIREVMGENCFLCEDWQTHYGIEIPQIELPPQIRNAQDLKELLLSPCPIESNGAIIKDTHFLFYAPAKTFTLLEWREKHPESGQPRFYSDYSDRWYNNQDFAKKTKNRYSLYLGYKKVLPNSTSKSYQDQLNLLPENYEPFLATELAIFLICYYKKLQEYLYSGIYGRCQDTDSGGYRVSLGDFDSDGLNVNGYSVGYCYSYLGVSALRKLFS